MNTSNFWKNNDLIFTNGDKENDVVIKEDVPTPKKIRVMFCGTYPIGQTNGYSRIVYNVAKTLGLKEDILLTIYGFQNYASKDSNITERKDIPKSVILHDAYATEDPSRSGFGELEIADYLKKNPQDIVIIFNDMIVTTMLVKNIVEKLSKEERKSFKLISYIDQVYPYQKPEYINILNTHIDSVITFTSYWKDTLLKLGLRNDMPIDVFPHGFDPTHYFPIPSKIARLYHAIPQENFIVLNLNRNQPRKRWDYTMMAFAIVVERHYKLSREQPAMKPIKLCIATKTNGHWNLLEIFKNELEKRNIPSDIGMKYIFSVETPQTLTDKDINILYNVCDIGLNTCDGEGFGLCQFEHLAVGKPQIVGNIGGFKEYIHDKNSTILNPTISYYTGSNEGGGGGYAEVCEPNEYADAIWNYYMSPEKCTQHGANGREEILQKYTWDTVIDMLYKIIYKTSESTSTPPSL